MAGAVEVDISEPGNVSRIQFPGIAPEFGRNHTNRQEVDDHVQLQLADETGE
jgi:hypothetical protein